MQELVRQAEERAAAAQRQLDEKQAARLLLLAATSGHEPADGTLRAAALHLVNCKIAAWKHLAQTLFALTEELKPILCIRTLA